MVASLCTGYVETADKSDRDMTDHAEKCPPADDWTLTEGLMIDIHEWGKFVDRGTVEAVTKDGCILWLAQEGTRPRRLVEKLPGTELRINPHHALR